MSKVTAAVWYPSRARRIATLLVMLVALSLLLPTTILAAHISTLPAQTSPTKPTPVPNASTLVFHPSDAQGDRRGSVHIRNNGTQLLAGHGGVCVKNAANKVLLLSSPMQVGLTVPGTSFAYPERWMVAPPLGTYHAHANVCWTGGDANASQ
jgi:hypothetical protein